MSLPFMTLALCALTQLLSIYCILLVLLRQSNSTATMVGLATTIPTPSPWCFKVFLTVFLGTVKSVTVRSKVSDDAASGGGCL